MREMFLGLLAALLNLLLTPLIILIARRKGWFDPIDERKIHTVATPRLGGVGIVLSFCLSLAAGLLIRPSLVPLVAPYWPLGLTFLLIHIVGVWDDFHNVRALYRFLVQLAVAAVVVGMGYRFSHLWLPGLGVVELGTLSYPITVIWIVGAINALNMIDGLDGLSGGISLIALSAYAMIFLARGQGAPALLAFCLAGAVIGFLYYNLPIARTFMGDGGSTVMGFALAVFPLLDGANLARGFAVWDAGTLLIIPIFDVIASMMRRAKQGVPLMSPDRWHLHHKLLHLGYNVRSILALIYSLSIGLSLVVAAGLYLSELAHWLLLVAAWLFILIFFLVLHYKKERSMHDGSEPRAAAASGCE